MKNTEKTIITITEIIAGIISLFLFLFGGSLIYIGATTEMAETIFPIMYLGGGIVSAALAFMTYNILGHVGKNNAVTNA